MRVPSGKRTQPKIGVVVPGPQSHRRRMRVLVEGKGRNRTLKIVRAPFDPTGLKVMGDPKKGKRFVTPFGKKELARRRAARKVSHESRRRNAHR